MNSAGSLQLDFQRPHQAAVSLEPRSWRGFRAEQVVLQSDEPYAFSTVGETHYLALHDMRLDDGELHIDGLPPVRRADLRDTLTYAPRGCAITGWAKPRRGRNSFTAFYFEPEQVCDDLDARYAQLAPGPFAYARDAALTATMSKLRGLVASPSADRLYGEALCLAAAIEILGVQPSNMGGPLSQRQLALIADFADAHLHRPITLDELATVAGLSRSHFSRAFKAATGQGPYRFITNRRIERACTLLGSAERLSIGAVAEALGFANAGVFRRAFFQITGMTPQRYRQERC